MYSICARYNIPELSKKFKVYAVDLLGFGWSDKALVDYTVALWKDQLADFLSEVVQQPAVLAGNRSTFASEPSFLLRVLPHPLKWVNKFFFTALEAILCWQLGASTQSSFVDSFS